MLLFYDKMSLGMLCQEVTIYYQENIYRVTNIYVIFELQFESL